MSRANDSAVAAKRQFEPVALELPTTVKKGRLLWDYAIGIWGIHILACLAFLPWLFSWTGVVVAVIGVFFFGQGVNLGYHRLLTHRAAQGAALVRVWTGRRRAVLPPGHADQMGHPPPGAPSLFGPPGRPAQPLRQFLLGPYGVDLPREPGDPHPGRLQHLYQGPFGRPLLPGTGAQMVGLERHLPGACGTVLFRRPSGRLGGLWRHHGGCPARAQPSGLGRLRAHLCWSGTSPGR